MTLSVGCKDKHGYKDTRTCIAIWTLGFLNSHSVNWVMIADSKSGHKYESMYYGVGSSGQINQIWHGSACMLVRYNIVLIEYEQNTGRFCVGFKKNAKIYKPSQSGR